MRLIINTFEQGEEGIRQAEEMGFGNTLHPHQIVLQSATNILVLPFLFSASVADQPGKCGSGSRKAKMTPNK
jgi:hypothetical protein